MAKDKQKPAKGPKSAPNKHLHARISFLHHAATYLASRTSEIRISENLESIPADKSDISQQRRIHIHDSERLDSEDDSKESDECKQTITFRRPSHGGLPFHMSSQLQQVAQKSQIRLHSSMKHASCKRCNAVSRQGVDQLRYLENVSRHGSKPQADILVSECRACSAKRRFPIGAKRQQKKTDRGHTGDDPSVPVRSDRATSLNP